MQLNSQMQCIYDQLHLAIFAKIFAKIRKDNPTNKLYI
jgi:hypothetical protein